MTTDRLMKAVCAVLLAVAGGGPAKAQTPSDGEAVLAEMEKFTRSLQTIVGDMHSTMVLAGQTVPMRSRIWAQLPDKVMNITEMAGDTVVIYVVGNQQITYLPAMNGYATMQLPASLAPALVQEFVNGGLSDAGVFASKPEERKVNLTGRTTVAGAPARQLRIEIPGRVVGDLWIAEGDQPLPLFVRFSSSQAGLRGEARYQWLVNQPIPESAFRFSPPPGATDMTAGRSQ